ncbi:MAG: YddF family protein, partial [Terriglobia bacterium]
RLPPSLRLTVAGTLWSKVLTKMVTLLNTSALTIYGSFKYEPLTLEEARSLVADGFDSAIGHVGTAEVLSELLHVPVPLNRVEYFQQPGEKAIVFKLKSRIPAGVILDRQQIEEIGYEFGLLTRTG